MTDPGARIFYEFSGFRLDPQQRLLLSSAEGRPIPLPPKAFEALLYFVERRGELLEKTTLMKAIWPNIIVEENSLNQNISVIRRALGESPGEHRFIVTEPGRGYRFVADVGVVAESPSQFAGSALVRPPSSNGASALESASGQRKSIAVLAFSNLTGDPAKEYFGDGMAEELIHTLARIPGLEIPSRTSSFAYKGRNADIRQIARDLGVSMILEGSVRSAGDRIRVTAQLVNAESGFHIWSQTFDRQFSDVFQLQDELAGAILQKLELNLGRRSRPLLKDDPPTRNVEAYRLYLQARATYFSAGLTADRVERMIEILERSISLDPDFPRAHALRGLALGMQVQMGSRGPEVLDEAMQEAERARALDPALPDAYALLSTLQAGRGQWCAADASFCHAIALDPKEPSTYLTRAVYGLAPTGHLLEAIEQASTCYQLAPAMVGAAVSLAGLHSLAGQEAEVADYLSVITDLGAPPQAPVPIFRSQSARRAGRNAEAAEHMMVMMPPGVRALGSDGILKLVFTAFADDTGKSSAAISALRALQAALDPQIADAWPMAILMLNWYAMLGALDDAYAIAERIATSFERTGRLILINLPPIWLPELKAFRQDPRFREFTTRLGFVDYWRAHGPPDGCELKDGKLMCQ
jgi:TolB-like protein